MTIPEDCRYGEHKGNDVRRVYDAQNIYLCKVCSLCETAKLAEYRPEILSGYDQSDVDEPLDPDDGAMFEGDDSDIPH